MTKATGYSTNIIADSLSPSGKRLTTWELRYPRMVHAELMTHRAFSRNSASSRAIPTSKLLAQICEDPALPVFWGKNQSGMQAAEELSSSLRDEALALSLRGRDTMVQLSKGMADLGVHKQLANRPVEPWMFITVIVSSTEFENWFGLRNHKDAQPEIGWVAKDMHEKFNASKPVELRPGEWHLPYVRVEDYDEVRTRFKAATPEVTAQMLASISTGRCARVSYLTQDGRRDLVEDFNLHDKLASSGHWSPFEHAAMAVTAAQWQHRVDVLMAACRDYGELFDPSLVGNLVGWAQYRKFFSPGIEMRRVFKWDTERDAPFLPWKFSYAA